LFLTTLKTVLVTLAAVTVLVSVLVGFLVHTAFFFNVLVAVALAFVTVLVRWTVMVFNLR